MLNERNIAQILTIIEKEAPTTFKVLCDGYFSDTCGGVDWDEPQYDE
jgi:hypothetical protein